MTRTMASVTLPYVTVSLASTLASAQSESMHLQLSPFFFSNFVLFLPHSNHSSCLFLLSATLLSFLGGGGDCYLLQLHLYDADYVHSSHTFGCLYKMNMSET